MSGIDEVAAVSATGEGGAVVGELLSGVVVPLVTPMSAPGVPSAEAAEPLLAAMASAGVRRLMLLGSNGEGPLIPAEASVDFVAGVTKQWRELVPAGTILVNVTAPGTAEAERRADDAAAAGADAIVASPPTFFNHRDDEVIAHFAALGHHGLPVVAYNTPRSTLLTKAAADALVAMPHMAGVKDSSGDPDMLRYLLSIARPGFEVSQGDEKQLADAVRAGVHGITPGIANLAPALALEMFAAGAELGRLQELSTALTKIHLVRPGVPTVKALLNARGLCPTHCAPPLAPCTADEVRRLSEVVAPLEAHLISRSAA